MQFPDSFKSTKIYLKGSIRNGEEHLSFTRGETEKWSDIFKNVPPLELYVSKGNSGSTFDDDQQMHKF